MLKDRIIEIITTLNKLTEAGVLEWQEIDINQSTRSYRRKMKSVGEDGSEYEIEIKFILNGESWDLSDEGLWLKNSLLPNGHFYITSHRSENEVLKLRDTILKRFCGDMNPSIEDIEFILDDMIKGINISSFRDGKLKKILE